MDLTSIITLLSDIQQTQKKLLETTTNFNERLHVIEESVANSKTHKIRRLRVKHPSREPIKYNRIDIIDIQHLIPQIKHVDIVLFGSIEFAFCIVLIETLCELSRINKECTKFVYEELAFCDNHYHIDTKTQLLRIKGWFNNKNNYRNIIPFKNKYIDIDKKQNDNSVLGYYNGQWCSSSYKTKLLSLYEAFCIKIIRQFCKWQAHYKREIELNKLPKHLDYSECVLKIMGCPDDLNNMDRSINRVCDYLGQVS